MSVVRLTREAIPHMREAGGGSIVNITALSVLQPIARFGLSVATWAAVLGYAKTLSLEVAADNITVNTICPGRIATGRLETVFGAGDGKPTARRSGVRGHGEERPAPAASARRKRSPAWWRCSPRLGAPTSPARRSTSTAVGTRPSPDATSPTLAPLAAPQGAGKSLGTALRD